MLQLLVIGCGGAVGALMRYVLGSRIALVAGNAFPWGTLIINVVGCFLAGLLLTLFVTRIPVSDLLRNGIQIGLLGGFTTFSAFSNKSVVTKPLKNSINFWDGSEFANQLLLSRLVMFTVHSVIFSFTNCGC